MTSRFSSAAPILASLAIVLVTLGVYVGGYFWLGDEQLLLHSGGGAPVGTSTLQRTYRHRWQALVFAPAARVEAWWRGVDVELTTPRD
jgi:hypothetical protein